MIIISDIHGCYKTLLKLLKQCPDEQLVFLGDLVDRGPDSASVVRFAMDNKIPTLMGNHEDLMLSDHGLSPIEYDNGLWAYNGGDVALASFGGKVPEAVLRWASGLPMALDYPDGLMLSHTGFGDDPNRMGALWHRDSTNAFESDGKFRVFGHTPSKFPIMGSNFARIDTGAAYSKQGFGVLTAFQWPERRVFSQPYDES